MELTLEIEQVTKRYDNLVAVNGVDLCAATGETLGLLGPNGAGKSTLMHCMVGVLQPDAGTIRLAGGNPAHPSTRRRIGFAPQKLSLYAELSGAENMHFLGSLYGLSGAHLRSRVDWALDFAGLVDRRKDPVSQYSGGMQRRLNLAAALFHEPEIVLLDEPTAGVDPQSRNHIFEAIQELHAKGLTVIYTTHYMEEAERLCDRVAIMDHGEILALDTVDNLIVQHGGPSLVRAELDEDPPADFAWSGERDGRNLCFRTEEPERVLADLGSRGLPLRELSLERADLEAVFLALTGKSLRDA